MAELSFFPVCGVEDLGPGDRLFVAIGDMPVVLFNIAGDYYAIGDVCTHDDGPLGDGEVIDHQIVCPRHGARFDIRTGEVLTLPATHDVPHFPLRIVDGTIEIGLEM